MDELQGALEALRTKIRCALRAMSGDSDPEIAEDRVNLERLRREEKRAADLENEIAEHEAKASEEAEKKSGAPLLITNGGGDTQDAPAPETLDPSSISLTKPRPVSLTASLKTTGTSDDFDDLDELPEEMDWAHEREVQISYLEQENKALRRMLGILPQSEGGSSDGDWGVSASTWETEMPVSKFKASGGAGAGSKFGLAGGRHTRVGSFGWGEDPGSPGPGGGGGGIGLGVGGGIMGGRNSLLLGGQNQQQQQPMTQGRVVMTPFGLGVSQNNSNNAGGGVTSGWLGSFGLGGGGGGASIYKFFK